MLAIIVIFAFAVYLVISIGVVVFAVKWAKRAGRSACRWGFIAALFMYLLVFWDHIPTLMLHKYYCENKAGIWVYKTPEQWKQEHPGVAETLTWQSVPPSYKGPNITRGYKLNEKFVWVHQVRRTPIFPVRLDHESIVDLSTGETMIKRISVGSWYGEFALGGDDWRVLKFWVKSKSCLPDTREFGSYLNAFQQMGREIK